MLGCAGSWSGSTLDFGVVARLDGLSNCILYIVMIKDKSERLMDSGDNAWDTYLARLKVGATLGVPGIDDVTKNQACMALCHALVYSVKGESMRPSVRGKRARS